VLLPCSLHVLLRHCRSPSHWEKSNPLATDADANAKWKPDTESASLLPKRCLSVTRV
jgi:hypothetical protein